ncbi:MAG TPA: phosphoglucosamine mutase [Candidatus Marinimicrobia bacterium]|nr:phosphoglucosamine mutase [Candidatus Neomarinimicrobiota bacterium]
MLIESLSGVRGIESELTEDFIRAYAYAFAEVCPPGKILVGRDTRQNGMAIITVLLEALKNTGRTVINLGICPTPTVQFAVEDQQAAGGIVITASHNPLPWNGLKFIGSDGIFLDADQMRQLKERRIELNKEAFIQKGNGAIETYHRAVDDHIEAVLALPYLDESLIRTAGFKVVVDAVNGAAYRAVPEFLRRLGCEVIELNCNADQPFPRNPEPLPENLLELNQAVLRHKADLGCAIDPDGDRLAIVSELGKPVSEEYTLVLAAKLVLSKFPDSAQKVVTNLSTTMAVEDVARQYGASVIRTAIGEINVAKKMREIDAAIGGEGNGGVLLPEAHLGRDSLVAAALILQLLAEKAKSVSELMQELPHYEMVKLRVSRGDLDLSDVLDELKQLATPADLDLQDGIKFIWSDRWVHLRPSNTEPIIRIYAEAKNAALAQEAAEPFVAFFTELSK